MIEELAKDTSAICCCSLSRENPHSTIVYVVGEDEESTMHYDDDAGASAQGTHPDDVGIGACGSCCCYRAPRRYSNFLSRQSYISIRTAGAQRVVRRLGKRNLECRQPFLLFIICWLLAVRPVRAVENTLDMLRDEPGVSGAQISQKQIQCNESRLCITEEDNEPSQVCGSDGRTYNSVCEIKKAMCHGSPVQQKYKGPCSEKSKCALERAFQMELSKQKNRTAEFIPECEADGGYSTVQCHNTFGYCWCVSNTGRPVPGTSVQFKRPNCPKEGKVGRRSSRRRLGTRRRVLRRLRIRFVYLVCSTADRSTFSSNLIKLFRSEFEQDPQNKRRSQDVGVVTSPMNKVIDWKFNNLDTDRNNKITRKEISTLKRLTVNLVQPKACAKRFNKYCDLDHDKKISRSEWSVCLGVDINIALRILMSLNPKSTTASPMMNDRASQHHTNVSGLHAASLLTASSSGNGDLGGFMLREKPAAQPESHEEEKNDCKAHRQKAIEDHSRNPNSAVYIPTCKSPEERLYDHVQCHAATGFCWCSEPESGRPIAGTSLENMRPNCQNLTKNVNEFKGCNANKRLEFFVRLYATLESSMIASGNGDYNDEVSRKEMAVRWQFAQLDKNKNKKLDRKEWRDYRNELKSWKGVRKCGRNFLRFCDQNVDKRITMSEWLECTIAVVTKPINVGRKGPNPFTTILDPNQ